MHSRPREALSDDSRVVVVMPYLRVHVCVCVSVWTTNWCLDFLFEADENVLIDNFLKKLDNKTLIFNTYYN